MFVLAMLVKLLNDLQEIVVSDLVPGLHYRRRILVHFDTWLRLNHYTAQLVRHIAVMFANIEKLVQLVGHLYVHLALLRADLLYRRAYCKQ